MRLISKLLSNQKSSRNNNGCKFETEALNFMMKNLKVFILNKYFFRKLIQTVNMKKPQF